MRRIKLYTLTSKAEEFFHWVTIKLVFHFSLVFERKFRLTKCFWRNLLSGQVIAKVKFFTRTTPSRIEFWRCMRLLLWATARIHWNNQWKSLLCLSGLFLLFMNFWKHFSSYRLVEVSLTFSSILNLFWFNFNLNLSCKCWNSFSLAVFFNRLYHCCLCNTYSLFNSLSLHWHFRTWGCKIFCLHFSFSCLNLDRSHWWLREHEELVWSLIWIRIDLQMVVTVICWLIVIIHVNLFHWIFFLDSWAFFIMNSRFLIHIYLFHI